MYPATLYCKKPLLPIYNNGIIEPAIYILLRELDNCEDIDEIILIKGKEDSYDFESKKIRYVTQFSPDGLGDAIYKCKDFIKDDYFMVLLGDMIYKSKKISCTQQLINFHKKHKKMIMGLKIIKIKDKKINGMIKGKRRGRTINITDFVEKPDIKTSIKMKLIYGTFGNYILHKDIFDLLKYADFPEALDIISSHGDLMGYLEKGESFDIGIPRNYYKAFKNFNKS